MKTLYVRIAAIFVLIVFISAGLALLIANHYYANRLLHYNEDKVLPIAEQVRDIYEASPDGTELDAYLDRVARMGFQIYLADQGMNGTAYGDPFKQTTFNPDDTRHVLSGGIYLGMLKEQPFLKISGYFENSIRNTVGIPIQSGDDTYALFIRPNLQQQIGEIRILLAFLLGHAFMLILALIVVLTRTIVKPLKALKVATKKIVGGDYKIELDVRRRDEIGELARHFSQMAVSLERLDDMRQEFVANVSHEFQTPVTSIQGFAQAILNKETTELEEEQYLRIIHEESKRLSSLSKQLLMLAALDKDTALLKRAPFRLDEQLRQALIVMEWQWSEKQLDIDMDLPEVLINADEGLLYQVWMNIISNSIKFSRRGDRLSIDMNIEKDIIVTISDTGIGIPQEELPYIFDRFYKADKSRNRSLAGSGLGLSICRKIVELHGGAIEASSTPREETRFTVKLPYL